MSRLLFRADVLFNNNWRLAIEDSLNSGQDPFSWHKGNEEGGYKTIKRDKDEILNIAKLDGGMLNTNRVLRFTFDGNEPTTLKSKYRIWVRIHDEDANFMGAFFGYIESTYGRPIEQRGTMDELDIWEEEGGAA